MPTAPEGVPDSGHASLTASVRRELWIMSRSRRLMAGILGGCLAAATIYNYATRPLYESVSVISLDQAGDSILNARASVDSGRMQDALQEQVRRLKSQELALLAVEPSELLVRQELALGPVGSWSERFEEEALYLFGRSKSHGTSGPEMVTAFRSRLAVEFTPPDKWVYVRFRGYDPQATATALNLLIDVYLEETAKATAGASGASRQQLERKVTERQGKVVETLGKLEAFERKEGLRNVDARRDLLAKELARLQDALITARQTRLSRRAASEEAARLSPSAMLSIPTVRDDREVAEAASRLSDLEARVARAGSMYGDLHPELVALRSELEQTRKRIDARLSMLKDAMAREYRLAEREEADIAAGIAAAQRSLAQLEKNSVEYSFIQKQAEAGQKAVGELIEKSVRDSDEQVFFAPRILQRATPASSPVSPQRARNFQIALVAGTLLAIALAWLRAHLDETVRTPDDVRAHFDLPLMGMVPRQGAGGADMFSQGEGPPSRILEAYRLLRTNLVMGPGAADGPRIVLITSSREGEGKTTTSRGLASALARAGNRVLLVDGDLRRASLSHLLSASDGPGLVEVIEGAAAPACVIPTAVPGLDLLPAGRHHDDAAELLSRDVLAGAFGSLRADYDWIVIDAPPVLAVADAAVLCRVADVVLVVVGANVTPVASIRATLDQLVAVRARIAGLVLNNVDLDRDSHYYRHYYSSQYEDYSSGAKRGKRAGAERSGPPASPVLP